MSYAAAWGRVVHAAIEGVTRGLIQSGCESINSACAVAAMKKLGGMSQLVRECIERICARESDNPRNAAEIEQLRARMDAGVGEMREQIATLLSRFELPRGVSRPAEAGWSGGGRRALGPGAYAEIRLEAANLGWIGIVDLLVLSDDECRIVDFKTGVFKEWHDDQIEIYSLLWHLDDVLNPTGSRATSLAVLYQGRARQVTALNEIELNELKVDLEARTRDAEMAISQDPPVAHPSADNCSVCDVRHLCDAYWDSDTASNQEWSPDREYSDAEVEVKARHGPTSWDGIVTASRSIESGTTVVVRLDEVWELDPGDRIRVLDAASAPREDEREPRALNTFGWSEVFWLPDSS